MALERQEACVRLTDGVDKFQHETADVQVSSRVNCLLDVQVRDKNGQIPRTVRRRHYQHLLCVSRPQHYADHTRTVDIFQLIMGDEKKTRSPAVIEKEPTVQRWLEKL